MILIEKTEVMGFEQAIRGMRNPMNSWENSDSYDLGVDPISNRIGHVKCTFQIGPNDHELMMKLVKGGPVHAKFRRMIAVYVDITAPLYWWKEFDTYKVGTVANSCSTMHKIHDKRFEMSDFSTDHLLPASFKCLGFTVKTLNEYRDLYLGYDGFKSKYGEHDKKDYWWQMIQLLPSSYNQKRTVMLNYEVLAGIYPMRKNHKLDEWGEFCKWVEGLPYSYIITGRLPIVPFEPVRELGVGYETRGDNVIRREED